MTLDIAFGPYQVSASIRLTLVPIRATTDSVIEIIPVGTVSVTNLARILDADRSLVEEVRTGPISLPAGNYFIEYPAIDGARTYQVDLLGGNIVPRILTNPASRFDVNNDGQSAPIDALIVINGISRLASAPDGDGFFSDELQYLDVNEDNQLTPIDALNVMNHLALREIPVDSELATPPLIPSIDSEPEETLDAALPPETLSESTETIEAYEESVDSYFASQERVTENEVEVDETRVDDEAVDDLLFAGDDLIA
ncbi:MAG: dockerin type I domain-containing protein [Pirellulaceae bacterium]